VLRIDGDILEMDNVDHFQIKIELPDVDCIIKYLAYSHGQRLMPEYEDHGISVFVQHCPPGRQRTSPGRRERLKGTVEERIGVASSTRDVDKFEDAHGRTSTSSRTTPTARENPQLASMLRPGGLTAKRYGCGLRGLSGLCGVPGALIVSG
jgi:hypothetical protein